MKTQKRLKAFLANGLLITAFLPNTTKPSWWEIGESIAQIGLVVGAAAVTVGGAIMAVDWFTTMTDDQFVAQVPNETNRLRLKYGKHIASMRSKFNIGYAIDSSDKMYVTSYVNESFCMILPVVFGMHLNMNLNIL
jgi:hypothetical protein